MRWPEDTDWWRALRRRYAARPAAGGDGAVRIGFVFGPRARARLLGGARRVALERGGERRLPAQRFASTAEAARLWIDGINASFERAGIAPRLAVGALGRLRREAPRPSTPSPREALRDLLDGVVRDERDERECAPMLPPECWAARHALNALVAVVDWGVTAPRLRAGGVGGLGGLTPCPAEVDPSTGRLAFAPVAVVDLRCALAAHTVAHELGHVLGLPHTDTAACGLPAVSIDAGAVSPVMNVAPMRELSRRLEWMRPARAGEVARAWHSATRDEAAWLRAALPQLAAHRFACAGGCDGACGAVRDGAGAGDRAAPAEQKKGPRSRGSGPSMRPQEPQEETTVVAAAARGTGGREVAQYPPKLLCLP
jgi:hypothetical protein